MRHFIAILALLSSGAAAAADVALIGVMGDTAVVLAIDGGEPKVVKIGQTWRGVRILTVERTQATVEIEGNKRVLKIGQHYRSAAAPPSDRQSVSLAADPRGHFLSEGAVNGHPIRFLLDTGATMVTLPAAEAQRLGIDYRKGTLDLTRTANGVVPVYRIRLDTVKLGSIVLNSVDAVVLEQGLDIALLGMSFLNRVEMRREGDMMMLIRRF